MADGFAVTVYRVNESAHQESEFTLKARSITVADDGSLKIDTDTGGATHGATTWGAIKIVRVPGRID